MSILKVLHYVLTCHPCPAAGYNGSPRLEVIWLNICQLGQPMCRIRLFFSLKMLPNLPGPSYDNLGYFKANLMHFFRGLSVFSLRFEFLCSFYEDRNFKLTADIFWRETFLHYQCYEYAKGRRGPMPWTVMGGATSFQRLTPSCCGRRHFGIFIALMM